MTGPDENEKSEALVRRPVLVPKSKIESMPLSKLAIYIKTRIYAGERATRVAIEKYLEAGDALISAKARLAHGHFGPWLERNMPDVTWRTVNRLMKNASEYECLDATRKKQAQQLKGYNE